MSCGCSVTPCSCVNTTCPADNACTPEPQDPSCFRSLCTGPRANNVWVEGAVQADGTGGICLLDTMELCQIINSIQRDDKARSDLLTITDNEFLLNLAHTLPPLPKENEGDLQQKELNQNTIPFYSVFRGQPPFAQ